jgi:hypothetical protein
MITSIIVVGAMLLGKRIHGAPIGPRHRTPACAIVPPRAKPTGGSIVRSFPTILMIVALSVSACAAEKPH